MARLGLLYDSCCSRFTNWVRDIRQTFIMNEQRATQVVVLRFGDLMQEMRKSHRVIYELHYLWYAHHYHNHHFTTLKENTMYFVRNVTVSSVSHDSESWADWIWMLNVGIEGETTTDKLYWFFFWAHRTCSGCKTRYLEVLTK